MTHAYDLLDVRLCARCCVYVNVVHLCMNCSLQCKFIETSTRLCVYLGMCQVMSVNACNALRALLLLRGDSRDPCAADAFMSQQSAAETHTLS